VTSQRRRVKDNRDCNRHLANDLFLALRRAERSGWPMRTSGTGWLGFRTLGGHSVQTEPDAEFLKALSFSEPRLSCPPHAIFMPRDQYESFLLELSMSERLVWDDVVLHRAVRAIWHLNRYSEARGGGFYMQRNPEIDERIAAFSLVLLERAEVVEINSLAAKEIEEARKTAEEKIKEALSAANS
jgi:hypothetical protein